MGRKYFGEVRARLIIIEDYNSDRGSRFITRLCTKEKAIDSGNLIHCFFVPERIVQAKKFVAEKMLGVKGHGAFTSYRVAKVSACTLACVTRSLKKASKISSSSRKEMRAEDRERLEVIEKDLMLMNERWAEP